MVPGFWLDVDYGNSEHERRNLPPTEADALELIAAIRGSLRRSYRRIRSWQALLLLVSHASEARNRR